MNYKRMLVLCLGAVILISAQGCKPAVVVSVDSLDFGATETQKTFQVWNKTNGTQMNFEIVKTAEWLQVSPATGSSKGPSEKVTITVTVSRSNLQKGTYTDTLKIKSSQDGEAQVNVSMTVGEPQEGEPEGSPEGTAEGTMEGTTEGTAEGTAEGSPEGTAEGTTEGTQEGEPEGQPEPNISIIGWVKDTNSNPLAYATIELLNTSFKVYTDQTGLYSIEDVPQGTYVLSAYKNGYAPYSIEVTVGDILPVTVNVTLAKQIYVKDVPDIENGATVNDSKGNAITIPPDSVVDKDGNPVTGPVEVYITPLDLSKPDDILAFPGEFQGISLSKQGERVQLESYALADFTLKKDGEEVYLNTSGKAMALVILDLPDDSPLNDGEEIPLWYFDEAQGLWIESGTGTVRVDEVSGNKYYEAQVQHLTWWNCDAPITDKTCIQGIVKDNTGIPIAGAVVKAVGSSYNGVTTTYTDTTGSFCLNVKGNSTVTIQVYLPGSNIPISQQEENANSVGNSCETGGCINIGEIIAEFNSCIQGTVTGSDGNPVPNITVYSSIGTKAVTDSFGHYCLDAIGDISVTVYVITRPPVTVKTQVGTTCSAGNCVNADIKVEYPKDGSYVGLVNVILHQQAIYQNQYSISSSAIFASFPAKPVEEPNDQCSFQSFVMDFSQEHYLENLPPINWSGLDPGDPGLFQAVDKQADLIRLSNWYQYEGSSLQPWMYSVFNLDYSNPIYTTQSGPTFSASWPGGLDIGAFEISGQIPPNLIITSPPFTQDQYGLLYFDFNPNEDLNIVWDAPQNPVPGSYVSITLSSQVYNQQDQTVTTYIISCIVADDGSHVIPRDLLQQIPTTQIEGKQFVYVNLSISRHYTSESSVPLVKGGNGKLVIDAQTLITANNYSSYLPVKK